MTLLKFGGFEPPAVIFDVSCPDSCVQRLQTGGLDQLGVETPGSGERPLAQPEDDREDQGDRQRDAERTGPDPEAVVQLLVVEAL